MNAFSMKTTRVPTVFLTFDEKSCVNILGRTKNYFAIYRFRNSLYSSHYKTKWYSSSRLFQNLHFRFSKVFSQVLSSDLFPLQACEMTFLNVIGLFDFFLNIY